MSRETGNFHTRGAAYERRSPPEPSGESSAQTDAQSKSTATWHIHQLAGSLEHTDDGLGDYFWRWTPLGYSRYGEGLCFRYRSHL